jgi:O-antigen/teichoic acid export membrane protein
MLGRYNTTILRAIYLFFVARWLGPELFGLINYAQAWYLLFIPLFQFGFGILLSKSIGNDTVTGSQVARQILAIRLISLLIISALCLILGILNNEEKLVQQLIMVMTLALAGRCIAIHYQQIFTAFEKTKFSLKVDLIFRPAELFFALTILFLTKDILLLAWVHALSWLLQGLYAGHLSKKHFSVHQPLWHWYRFPALLWGSLPIAISILFSESILQWPVIAIKVISAVPEDLGNIALINQGIMIMLTVAYAVAAASVPVLSRIFMTKPDKVSDYVSFIVRAILLGGTALFILTEHLAKWLVLFVFGESYVTAAENIYFLFWVVVPASLVIILRATLLSMGHNILVLIINTCSAIAFFSLVNFLTWDNKIAVIMVALVAAYGVQALMKIIYLIRNQWLEVDSAMINSLLLVITSISVYVLVGRYNLTLSICVSTLFLCLFLLKTLKTEEKRNLYALAKRVYNKER